MLTLLGLFICSVLIATGASLECEVCTGTGTTCTGRMETCDEGKDTCFIAVSASSVAGMQMQTVVKGCESSKICNLGAQYMHFGRDQSQRTRIACCVGDACRTTTPQVPPLITQHNKKQCPACFSLFSSRCGTEELVDCVGPETHCLDMRATVSYATIVINTAQKGCVSEEVCSDPKLGEAKLAGIRSVVTHAECRPASPKA